MLTRAQAAKELVESQKVEGGGMESKSAPGSCISTTSSVSRANLIARQRAAEAKLQRKLADLMKQTMLAEEAAARAEFEAESAAVEAEEKQSHSSVTSNKWCDYADTHIVPGKPSLELIANFLHNEASKQARYMPRFPSSGISNAPLPDKLKAAQVTPYRIHNNVLYFVAMNRINQHQIKE
ncbi:hypothetical protein ACJJTC_014919 [Scirpophaga incertulas]